LAELPSRFFTQAEDELLAEALFYERVSPRLGERFTAEVQASVSIACRYPGVGSPYLHGTRRVFTRRFPFSVVYLPLPTEVVVVAIAPFAKRPGYWRSRAG